MALCYNRLGNKAESEATNQLALLACIDLKQPEMLPYIRELEGVNQFYRSNYNKSIQTIKNALPAIRKDNDFANEAVGIFYIGKSYWELGNKQVAIRYFKQVDEIFLEKEYIRPDLRQNYELLIDYYKEKQDLKTQLHYINRLLEIDSVMNKSYKYLSGKIHKEYDTNKLIEARNKVENELEKEKLNDRHFYSSQCNIDYSAW